MKTLIAADTQFANLPINNLFRYGGNLSTSRGRDICFYAGKWYFAFYSYTNIYQSRLFVYSSTDLSNWSVAYNQIVGEVIPSNVSLTLQVVFNKLQINGYIAYDSVTDTWSLLNYSGTTGYTQLVTPIKGKPECAWREDGKVSNNYGATWVTPSGINFHGGASPRYLTPIWTGSEFLSVRANGYTTQVYRSADFVTWTVKAATLASTYPTSLYRFSSGRILMNSGSAITSSRYSDDGGATWSACVGGADIFFSKGVEYNNTLYLINGATLTSAGVYTGGSAFAELNVFSTNVSGTDVIALNDDTIYAVNQDIFNSTGHLAAYTPSTNQRALVGTAPLLSQLPSDISISVSYTAPILSDGSATLSILRRQFLRTDNSAGPSPASALFTAGYSPLTTDSDTFACNTDRIACVAAFMNLGLYANTANDVILHSTDGGYVFNQVDIPNSGLGGTAVEYVTTYAMCADVDGVYALTVDSRNITSNYNRYRVFRVTTPFTSGSMTAAYVGSNAWQFDTFNTIGRAKMACKNATVLCGLNNKNLVSGRGFEFAVSTNYGVSFTTISASFMPAPSNVAYQVIYALYYSAALSKFVAFGWHHESGTGYAFITTSADGSTWAYALATLPGNTTAMTPTVVTIKPKSDINGVPTAFYSYNSKTYVVEFDGVSTLTATLYTGIVPTFNVDGVLYTNVNSTRPATRLVAEPFWQAYKNTIEAVE